MEPFKSDPGAASVPDLRPEINRALAVRWFHEVWGERRTETIDELFPPHAIGHTEVSDFQGPAEFKTGREALLDAFPAQHDDPPFSQTRPHLLLHLAILQD